jgi:hypothetical protein
MARSRGLGDVYKRQPYAGALMGQIETLLYELARQRGLLDLDLWRLDAPAVLRPGDVVVVGNLGQAPSDPAARAAWLRDWGGLTHGFLVTGVSGLRVESSDGGQTDPLNSGYPTMIKAVTRELVQKPGTGWWLGTRRLRWRFRAGELPVTALPWGHRAEHWMHRPSVAENQVRTDRRASPRGNPGARSFVSTGARGGEAGGWWASDSAGARGHRRCSTPRR